MRKSEKQKSGRLSKNLDKMQAIYLKQQDHLEHLARFREEWLNDGDLGALLSYVNYLVPPKKSTPALSR